MEDAKIVELYVKREERAVSETMEKYGGMFYSIAFSLLRRREDAEECVNDAYVKLWGAIPPEHPDNLGTFGCRITRNLALNKIKFELAEKRSRDNTVELICDELEDCAADCESDAIVDRMALSSAISRFLSAQTPQHRIMFMRRYFYADDTSKIARMLHTTEPTVKMALYRLRKKLKKFLESEGVDV